MEESAAICGEDFLFRGHVISGIFSEVETGRTADLAGWDERAEATVTVLRAAIQAYAGAIEGQRIKRIKDGRVFRIFPGTDNGGDLIDLNLKGEFEQG